MHCDCQTRFGLCALSMAALNGAGAGVIEYLRSKGAKVQLPRERSVS